jgi:hypothetical protein
MCLSYFVTTFVCMKYCVMYIYFTFMLTCSFIGAFYIEYLFSYLYKDLLEFEIKNQESGLAWFPGLFAESLHLNRTPHIIR